MAASVGMRKRENTNEICYLKKREKCACVFLLGHGSHLDTHSTPSSVLLLAPGCATLQVKAVSLSTLSV
jgi:hypothetical protein